MKKTHIFFQQILLRFVALLTIVSILISCQLLPVTEQTQIESNSSNTASFETPLLYQTNLLNSLDVPHSYMEICPYLRARWNPLNAKPGTIVMAIRFDNLNKGLADLPNSISLVEFAELMSQLRSQGFDAINTRELQQFLEKNEPIPERSVYIIQTGNHDAEYFDKNFRDFWENWGWKIINGWVSEPDMPEDLLIENIELEMEGFVEHEASGVFPDSKLSDESAKNVIARELQGSWNGIFNDFGKSPTVIIWPNGGFGFRPVEAARQLGFRFGFTTNTRGPIMYNWVPLSDFGDPQRPSYVPEGLIDDPLMTLPTYSAQEALAALDSVRNISKEYARYAEENKEAEISYYENVCELEYPPIPSP